MPTPDRTDSRTIRRRAALLIVASAIGASAAIATDSFGLGRQWQQVLDRVERLAAGPLPERSSVPTEAPTTRPTATVEPIATHTLLPSPGATPRPTPARLPVDVEIARDPDAVFAHELRNTWCAPAGVQMTLAVLGLGDTSDALQHEIAGRVHEWERDDDSLNGGWGPSAMVAALADYGAVGYQVRAYPTREDALRGAAAAISSTEQPAILLAWRGAHTWVMTGYRADADPRLFPDAVISGAYVLDPWYPSVSSIWGASDPPGTFQDEAEMVRNFLPWKRPEGRYPDRDGLFIVLLPSVRPAFGG